MKNPIGVGLIKYGRLTRHCLIAALLLVFFTLILSASCLAQSHTQVDQYWDEAFGLRDQGLALEAARMFEQSALAEQASPEPRMYYVATSFFISGRCYFEVALHDKALEHYQQALEIVRKLGWEEDIAKVLYGIGEVYSSLGQYDKALEHYQQAIEIFRKLGRETKIATALNNIGFIYDSLGQYDKAIEHFQQAIEIDRKLGMELKSILSINKNGNVSNHDLDFIYGSLGQSDIAIEHYQQVIEISRKLGDETKIATILNNIGEVYRVWGLDEKAIEHYQQALHIPEHSGHRFHANPDSDSISFRTLIPFESGQ